MPRRLLVVTTTEVADSALRELVRSRAGDDAEMLVVAPASKISRLDWLTNAEDGVADARLDVVSGVGLGRLGRKRGRVGAGIACSRSSSRRTCGGFSGGSGRREASTTVVER